METYRHHVQAGVGPNEHERRLRAAIGAIQRARGGSRRNVGDRAIFEFRVDGLRGAALTVRDQVLHLAVV